MQIIYYLFLFQILLSKMPKGYDEKLWCNTCQAIAEEIGVLVKESHSEMVIDDALSNICTPYRFSHYEFPPPKMYKGCQDFIMEHYDDIENAFLNRQSNDTVETELCMRITNACVDEDLQIIKLIMTENNLNTVIDSLENLKSEDINKRIEAVQNLSKIAEVFGQTKTKQVLLPFLKEFKDDETKIMFILAQQLKLIGDYICQQEIHLSEIVPYFYLCFNYEDLSVINEALKSLKFLVEKYKFKHESIIALAKKLFQTKFTKSIISAVKISCELAEYIPSKYAGELSKIVTETSASNTTIIRRYVADSLRFIIKEKSPFVQLGVQCLKKLVSDPQDNVKVYAAQSLAFHKYSKTFFMKNLYPLIVISLEEKSWRVQYALLQNFENLIISTQSNSKKPLIDFFLNQLKSQEEEVVILCYSVLQTVSSHLEPEFITNKILPIIQENLKNENETIRMNVASAIPYLAPSIGKNSANKGYKEILLQFLKDKSNNVKLEIFNNIEPLDSVLPLCILMPLIQDTMNELLNDQNWKIRNRMTENLKVIIEKQGEEGKNNPFFVNVLKLKLQDRVFFVRKTTLEVIRQLAQSQGQKWADTQGIEILFDFYQNGNYLYRLNYLFGMVQIHTYLSNNVFDREISNICKMVKDPVPNVRLNVIRVLLTIYLHKKSESVKDKIDKIVSYLDKDEDHYISTLIKKISSNNYILAAQAIISEDYQQIQIQILFQKFFKYFQLFKIN